MNHLTKEDKRLLSEFVETQVETSKDMFHNSKTEKERREWAGRYHKYYTLKSKLDNPECKAHNYKIVDWQLGKRVRPNIDTEGTAKYPKLQPMYVVIECQECGIARVVR